IKRDSVKKVDAVRTTFASGTRYDSIKKVDAVRTTFASGTRYDSIKKEDSVRIPFASIKQTDSIKIAFERSTVKETEAPFIAASASADAVHYRLPRFSSWQLDPALHWGWGSGKDDTLIHKVVAVGATDSISKTTITKDNTPTAATKNKTQQSETTAATTSPNDKIKQTVTAIEKTSLIKSIMQNTFSNRYQKPGGQGVRMNNGQGPFSFLLNLGVTADEVYYANPTIQIGLPFLYGIASLSTNFNLVGARFGAGISAKLSDDWRLHLQGTTGRQLHYVDVGENNDSAGTHVRTGQVKSRILKFSLVAEKQLGERLRLQAGIVLNSQLLQYTMDDSTHTLSIAEMDQAYKQFNIIHAPYTISNTYGVNQNTKIWIGFQVGVFYNINFNKRK
ncbi:hypothetical protein, partial [Chitinophaga sp.]|uniref:hypothetical protein n=1 Tax=Chitinophaga sp. TaxID=1869181 RepID=UPI002F92A9F2